MAQRHREWHAARHTTPLTHRRGGTVTVPPAAHSDRQAGDGSTMSLRQPRMPVVTTVLRRQSLVVALAPSPGPLPVAGSQAEPSDVETLTASGRRRARNVLGQWGIRHAASAASGVRFDRSPMRVESLCGTKCTVPLCSTVTVWLAVVPVALA